MRGGHAVGRSGGRSVSWTVGPAALVAGFFLWASPLAAQYDECRPGAQSNEAKTLAILSVPLAFGAGAAPGRPSGVTFGFEAARVPTVDAATATPTICRPGKGPENTDLLPALARLRFGVPLPLGLALEASWVPPVPVNGLKANLVGVALAGSVGHANGLAAQLRAHATFGSLHAPVTCDQDALSDPVSECFHGIESDDRYSPNIMGLELSVGWGMAAGRLRPYLGTGYNRLQPRFQVNFTNQFGELDNRRVEVNLDRLALFAGGTWEITERLGLTGELYAAPADALTGRVVMRTAIGP